MKIVKIENHCIKCEGQANHYLGFHTHFSEDIFLCDACFQSFIKFVQPERSKREDLPCLCKDYDWCKMRCSEHCGNTVREAQ